MDDETVLHHIPKKIKLFYFNAPGRSGAIRLVLHYGGIEFQDVRIPPEKWLAKKSTFPFGQVPILEIDGVQLPETEAILRYLGILTELYPVHNLYQCLIVDSIVSTITGDLYDLYVKWMRSDKQMKDKVINEIRKLLKLMEQYLNSIMGRRHLKMQPKDFNPHFIFGKPSTADLVLFQLWNSIETGSAPFWKTGIPNFRDEYPTIATICDAVHTLPRVQSYLVLEQQRMTQSSTRKPSRSPTAHSKGQLDQKLLQETILSPSVLRSQSLIEVEDGISSSSKPQSSNQHLSQPSASQSPQVNGKLSNEIVK